MFCSRLNFFVSSSIFLLLIVWLAGRSDDRPQILLDQFNLYVFSVCVCKNVHVSVCLFAWCEEDKRKEEEDDDENNSAKKEPKEKGYGKDSNSKRKKEKAMLFLIYIFWWSSARSFTPVRHLILPVAVYSLLYFVHSLINGSAFFCAIWCMWLIITPLNWTKCVRVCVLKQISNKTISRIFIFGAQWDIVVALLKKFISIKYFDWNTPKIVRQRQQQYNSIHRNLNYFNKYLTGARVKKVSNHFVWFRFTPFWGFMCLIEFVSLFFCLLLSFVSAAAQEKMNWIICKWKQ